MTVGQFLKSYWKDCINNIKHPLNLLPTVLLSVVWIVLGWMAAKAKLALPLKVVSFLTFTEGGLFGGVIGAVGGIVGKVVVAAFVNAALLPLFHGKMPFSGVGNSFGQMASSMRLSCGDVAAEHRQQGGLFVGLPVQHGQLGDRWAHTRLCHRHPRLDGHDAGIHPRRRSESLGAALVLLAGMAHAAAGLPAGLVRQEKAHPSSDSCAGIEVK